MHINIFLYICLYITLFSAHRCSSFFTCIWIKGRGWESCTAAVQDSFRRKSPYINLVLIWDVIRLTFSWASITIIACLFAPISCGCYLFWSIKFLCLCMLLILYNFAQELSFICVNTRAFPHLGSWWFISACQSMPFAFHLLVLI